mgnify:CR=1 FL=1
MNQRAKLAHEIGKIKDAPVGYAGFFDANKVLEAVKFAEESPYPTVDEIYTDIYDQVDYPFAKD